jgi:hypothetical protein
VVVSAAGVHHEGQEVHEGLIIVDFIFCVLRVFVVNGFVLFRHKCKMVSYKIGWLFLSTNGWKSDL